jgi:hypothetical protein
MLNLRRITVVGDLALLFGLVALTNNLPPMPGVVMSTDPAAGSCMCVCSSCARGRYCIVHVSDNTQSHTHAYTHTHKHTHARTHRYHRHVDRESMHVVCDAATAFPCVAIVVLYYFLIYHLDLDYLFIYDRVTVICGCGCGCACVCVTVCVIGYRYDAVAAASATPTHTHISRLRGPYSSLHLA